MPSNGPRIRVWCEDRQHEQFARKFLTGHRGVDRRRIEFEIAPKGRGSASQWVIKRYSDVETKARLTHSQTRLGFLVIVDGDDEGVVPRKRKLCGEPDRRQDNDRIAIWVPTWSIETWVLWLCRQQVDNRDVDEARSFKSELDAGSFTAQVKAAVKEWSRLPTDETGRLPSLTDAESELRRLPLD